MDFFSTSNINYRKSFKEAAVKGLAPEKGLFFPSVIPEFPASFYQELKNSSDIEIAKTVMQPYISDTIPADIFNQIIEETFNFPIPLKQVSEQIYSLELFHGPTLAFKDIGARFMSRCLRYLLKEEKKNVMVLVATSGDTGGAVASGFLNVPGIDVVILFPSGKVSSIQEMQLTRFGNNIQALEVDGSFDDCQMLVKQAFADEKLNSELLLTSANSINIARWLPQQVYYFLALKQWPESQPPVISVPSGNMGNLCAGLLAAKEGLPVQKFIAACNSNDTIARYIASGKFQPEKVLQTVSNAMDVADPSNFIRMLWLFEHEYPQIINKVNARKVSDEETLDTIRKVYKEYNYLLDPHGAVGYYALEAELRISGGKGIFLETAHPVKFGEVIENATGHRPELPPQIMELMNNPSKSKKMPAQYDAFKSYLLSGAS